MPMELHLSPDVQEKLAHSAAKQGRNADELVHEVLTQYLNDEARFSVVTENWTDEERREAMLHVEGGFQQAERGELLDAAEARRRIDALKRDWLQQRSAQ